MHRKSTSCTLTLSLFDGKRCWKCRLWHPFTSFYQEPKRKDGYGTSCKSCKKIYTDEHDKKYPRPVRSGPPPTPEYNRQYRARNLERVKELTARWIANHPGYQTICRLRRRARKRNAEGSFTRKEWKELCEKYDNKCLCCGKSMPLSVDHVVPLSKGGRNSIDNLQPLCKPCNSRKNVKTTDYRF